MRNNRLLTVGMIGTVIAALCCFTPLLVLFVAAVGVGWITGYLDLILLPALFLFISLTLYAFWQQQKATQPKE